MAISSPAYAGLLSLTLRYMIFESANDPKPAKQ